MMNTFRFFHFPLSLLRLAEGNFVIKLNWMLVALLGFVIPNEIRHWNCGFGTLSCGGVMLRIMCIVQMYGKLDRQGVVIKKRIT